ncbi:MAG TPA: hypothetical protein VFQ30_08415 [Ktedonobacteraceae bacterium]|nr:hypothetical protein [Ktedonobacteraceae bacterium]
MAHLSGMVWTVGAGRFYQATRKGWPYYIQRGSTSRFAIVYSRAIPLRVAW